MGTFAAHERNWRRQNNRKGMRAIKACPRDNSLRAAKPVSLKTVAEYLKLSPATISVVLNQSPAAKAIPAHTQDRIRKAACKLDYRPNFFALA